MCGFAGIIKLDNIPVREGDKMSVRSMIRRLKHRGPDQTTENCAKDYFMGINRLVIVGDDNGSQPINDRGFSLIFNGEIYNYKDLSRNYLNGRGVESDTRILFYFLKKFGLSELEKLNGIFSFCFVTRDYIYLVRDRLGIKPLYYTYTRRSLLFSSEIKAFSGIVPLKLNITSLYRSIETNIGKFTNFENIFQVQPGCYVRINRLTKATKEIKYYDLSNINKMISGSESSLVEELRYTFLDSIRLRTDTKLAYGSYISGGFDSSIVAILAKPKFLYTFLPKNELIPDEEKYADEIAGVLSDSHYRKVYGNPDSVLSDLIDVVYANDGPTTSIAAHSQYLLAKAAANDNLRIVLSGLGADEFFSGYVRHALAILPKSKFSSRFFLGYDFLKNKLKELHKVNNRGQLYSHIINRSMKYDPMLDSQVEKIFSKSNDASRAISIVDSIFTLPPLLTMDDHINMYFGIESRSPFLDYRLVEFGLSLPQKYKLTFNEETGEVVNKYLLRKALGAYLPPMISNRTGKVGFYSNINSFLHHQLNDALEKAINLLKENFPNNEHYFDNNNNLGKFDRWNYQMLQIAISYKLFTEGWSREKVFDFFK